MSDKARDCEHGQLARSCDVCEHDAEVSRLTADLAACYRLSGADPDGNEDWRLAPYAVEEVTRLREELDEADATVVRLEARVAELEGRDPLTVFEGKP